jgi:hypothetical protein
MKKFLCSIIAVFFIFLMISCGGGKENTDCPAGYVWDGTECVPDNKVVVPDDDPIIEDQDKTTGPDEENDENTDDISDDEDTYTGECTPVKPGGNLEIDIKTRVVTIGTVTVNGAGQDSLLYGNLWARNTFTLSEFKLAEINGSLPGKKFNFPEGKYDFFFRVRDFDNSIPIKNGVSVSADTSIDLDLPLFHFSGAVTKNGSALNIDAENHDDTEITVRSGSYEFSIPYSDFSGFDILVPEGKYSVYFKGQLSAGKPLYEGTVFESDNGIEIEEDTVHNINIQTATYNGTVENAGYEINSGQLVLAENPPMGALTTVVIPDLADKSFSVEVIKGVTYALLYLPEEGTYPSKYIRLESWSDTDNPSTNGNKVTLDFGRLHGSVTFLGGANLPTVTNCSGPGCSRGKLKAVGFDMSSYLIKDFGVSGGDLNYEALIVRRTPTVVPDGEGTKIVDNPRNYTMVFESHLNDVEGVFDHVPFNITLKYLNADNASVSNFNFQNIDESFLTERSINFNIAPMIVEGTVKLNGTAFDSKDKSDYIMAKNDIGLEIPVINISELSNGLYSFFIPEGDYDIIYQGKGALGAEFRTSIEQNLKINSNVSSLDLNLSKVKLLAGFKINGEDFSDWAKDDDTVESFAILINPDKTAFTYYIPLTVPETGTPAVEILSGSTLNIYLEIYLKSDEKNEKSFLRMPMVIGEQIVSDTNLNMPLALSSFTTTIKVNGEPVKGASSFVGALKIPGQNRAEIYYPSKEGNKANAMLKKGEHKTPRPEITLNDGFDTKQNIQTNCIYIY